MTLVSEFCFSPKGKKRDALERWFDAGVHRIHCLAWDADTGMRWAALLATGKAIPIKDSLIAATAITHGLIIATRNDADFAHVSLHKFRIQKSSGG